VRGDVETPAQPQAAKLSVKLHEANWGELLLCLDGQSTNQGLKFPNYPNKT